MSEEMKVNGRRAEPAAEAATPPFGQKEFTSFSLQVPLQALLVLQLVLQLLLLELQLPLLVLFLQLKSKPGKRSLQRAEQLP
jgi:hypothetical protein